MLVGATNIEIKIFADSRAGMIRILILGPAIKELLQTNNHRKSAVLKLWRKRTGRTNPSYFDIGSMSCSEQR